ncbi:hypothetical protein AOQ84DRAFT_370770 [Glonium stellatum]|uniref:Uncharacterized protein n=1 Tax=Glonium stellatum TaxID=574774 RepID=A0A8E2FDJ1_9PEZI|nr:hypothetical protein AOQ84DRAFT_370770 [Glonium stellatum]
MHIAIGFAVPEAAETSTPALRARLRFAAIIPPSDVPRQCQRVALPAWGRGPQLSPPGSRPNGASEHLHLNPCFQHRRCIVDGGLVPDFSPVGAEACRAFLPQSRSRAQRAAGPPPRPQREHKYDWGWYFRADLPWYDRYLAKQPPPPVPPRPGRPHVLGKLAQRVEAVVAGSAPARVSGAEADQGESSFEGFDGVTEVGVREMREPGKAAPFPKIEVRKANTVSLLKKEAFIAYALRPKPIMARGLKRSQLLRPMVNMSSAFSTYGSDDDNEDNGSSVYSQSASLNSYSDEAKETDNVEQSGVSNDGERRIRRMPGLLGLGNLRNRIARFAQIRRPAPIAQPATHRQHQEVGRRLLPVRVPTPMLSPSYLSGPLLLPSHPLVDSLYPDRPVLRGSETDSSIDLEAGNVNNELQSPAVRIVEQDTDIQNAERLLAARNASLAGRLRVHRVRRVPVQVNQALTGWVRRFLQLALWKWGGARR